MSIIFKSDKTEKGLKKEGVKRKRFVNNGYVKTRNTSGSAALWKK